MQESPRARRAWTDYLSLGPSRSLEKLLDRYRTVPNPPTQRLPTLKAWSVSFGWQARLTAIADQEAAAAEAREADERRAAMETGYALGWQRVRSLKALADLLYQELTADGDDSRLWVRDVKQIGSGDFAEKVTIWRFNGSEVEQLRGVFSDLAKEADMAAMEVRLAALEERLSGDTTLGRRR